MGHRHPAVPVHWPLLCWGFLLPTDILFCPRVMDNQSPSQKGAGAGGYRGGGGATASAHCCCHPQGWPEWASPPRPWSTQSLSMTWMSWCQHHPLPDSLGAWLLADSSLASAFQPSPLPLAPPPLQSSYFTCSPAGRRRETQEETPSALTPRAFQEEQEDREPVLTLTASCLAW